MKRIIVFVIIAFSISSCNNHLITLSMLQEQLNPEVLCEIQQMKTIYYGNFELYKINYEPNGLHEVICIDKKTGKRIALSINKDTVLVITDKKNKKHRLYFDTVHVNENSIFGYYSRLINDPQEILIGDIERIEIHSEMSKKKEVN